ncbi:PAS/PAC sensor hybrid histidine kinase [Poseidonocella pacifica]|uniref:histidine kinase n=1 Tax=Poseidonocella pacifica TaxID=871651 RepID=A0A1I0WIW7_9RHOB|nr:response regulator [Poseidonocella pacifica]SFA88178.1 PAS/PAC sensor hybrid histidine kinase [Poseidonocella pacifica]
MTPQPDTKPGSDAGRIWLRNLLVAVLVGGVALSLYLGNALWQRAVWLDTSSRDNVDWAFSQLEVDFLKLEQALTQARVGVTQDLEELRKRFDIFYSRARIIEGLTDSDSEDILQLRRSLDEMIPIIDSSDARLMAQFDDLTAAIARVSDMPREIALSSIATWAERVEAERHGVARLVKVLAAVILLVTLALIGAVLWLWVQTKALHRASGEAEQSLLRQRTTLRASLDAIVVTDENDRILDFNGSAEDIFGIGREDAYGRSFAELFVPEAQRIGRSRGLQRLRRAGDGTDAEGGRREGELIRQDGTRFPAELSMSFTRTSLGPVIVSYIRDITEKKEREGEIMMARDAALAAYRDKSRFFAVMSHEMRTPLNGVLSALQLLEGTTLDAEQRGFLTAATTSGEILLDHITDVLTLERDEVGAPMVRPKAVDLKALTTGLQNVLDPLARTSGTRLTVETDGIDACTVVTDPRAVQQIVVNLVSNAIKFTPGGQVKLRAVCHKAEGEKPLLMLEVEDNGPGIPEADRTRIFRDFVTLEARLDRRESSTGLGLGIVRRLVEQLGGEVCCEAAEMGGARFVVALPVEPANAPASLPEARNSPSPRIPSKSVLVVDDNAINRELLEAMLHRQGHEVVLAEGGAEAVTAARSTPFDVILMDISMPGINGIQATRAIRSEDGPNKRTPVVAVTAHAMPEERAEFLAAGLDHFLGKPLSLADLAKCLAEVFAGQSAAPATKAAEGVLDERQLSDLIDLVGEETFVDRLKLVIAEVEEALPEFTDTSDLDHLASRAHAVGGMTGMYGALKFHQALKEIETCCKAGGEGIDPLLPQMFILWEKTRIEWEGRIRDLGADPDRQSPSEEPPLKTDA